MSIPKHDEIRIPILRLLDENTLMKLKEFEPLLASSFNLSDSERSKEYDSGNGIIFADRISWALSHLNIAGFINKPKRGEYALSEKGRAALSYSPKKLNQIIQKAILERKNRSSSFLSQVEEEIQNLVNQSNLTPQEQLYDSFRGIKASVYEDILNTIYSKTPNEFEKLVVKLLQKMGYGGEVKDSGLVTKASNDEGIDGIIKEDVLGFGKIYIQAKKYELTKTIGRPDLQKFFGALAGQQATKGIFICTCSFAKTAVEYVNGLPGVTIVLVDGQKLAEYIYEYGLRMQTEQTIEIKKLDSEFWDVMQDALN